MKDNYDNNLSAQAREKIMAAVEAGLHAFDIQAEQRRRVLSAAEARFPLADLYDIRVDWGDGFGANVPYDSPLLKAGLLDPDPSAPRYIHFKLKSVVLFFCETALALSVSSPSAAAILIALAAARISPGFRNLYRTFEEKYGQVLYEMYVLTNNGSRGVQVDELVLCSAVNARLSGEGEVLISASEFAAILGLLVDMDVLEKLGSNLRWKDVVVAKAQ